MVGAEPVHIPVISNRLSENTLSLQPAKEQSHDCPLHHSTGLNLGGVQRHGCVTEVDVSNSEDSMPISNSLHSGSASSDWIESKGSFVLPQREPGYKAETKGKVLNQEWIANSTRVQQYLRKPEIKKSIPYHTAAQIVSSQPSISSVVNLEGHAFVRPPKKKSKAGKRQN